MRLSKILPLAALLAILSAPANAAAPSYADAIAAYRNKDFAKAAAVLAPLAEAGNPFALFLLADIHLYGRGGPVDLGRAADLFRKAAESGHAGAAKELAKTLARHQGLARDKAEIVHWLRKMKDDDSRYMLRAMADFDGRIPRNSQEAFDWYEARAKEGDAVARKKACAYGRRDPEPDTDKAKGAAPEQWCLAAANAGDSEAALWLGLDHFGLRPRHYGAPFPDKILASDAARDKNEGLKWLRRAADAGNADAQAALALIYATGKSVETNHDKALEFAKKAAKAGNVEATTILGLYTAHGRGAPRDYKRAIELLKFSAIRRHDLANCALSYIYLHGLGVEPDYVEAEAWFLEYPRILWIRDYEPGGSYGDLPLGSCLASKANIDNMKRLETRNDVIIRKNEMRGVLK